MLLNIVLRSDSLLELFIFLICTSLTAFLLSLITLRESVLVIASYSSVFICRFFTSNEFFFTEPKVGLWAFESSPMK